ncbi:Shewanella-like protein phosphatase 1 [Porphyridium purpureum]|uniref:Shewanella-like protein phosphatase 1 n=1 Tax=Porphyridium purpureum TaxID=35688 RepID=A0A5J4Z841_PORPP|nr:Shewanella-like protein phosphatase 1 [Porphyridium purpureum]|eukprot:POR6340..scf295_1
MRGVKDGGGYTAGETSAREVWVTKDPAAFVAGGVWPVVSSARAGGSVAGASRHREQYVCAVSVGVRWENREDPARSKGGSRLRMLTPGPGSGPPNDRDGKKRAGSPSWWAAVWQALTAGTRRTAGTNGVEEQEPVSNISEVSSGSRGVSSTAPANADARGLRAESNASALEFAKHVHDADREQLERYFAALPEHLRQDAREFPTYDPATGKRIIAIGDVHGDHVAMLAVLRLAGLVPTQEQLEESPEKYKEDMWMGGDAVLVQVGDQLDRGDNERMILHTLLSLRKQARQQGGDIHVLLGNHEIMNVQCDFRYVTAGGFEEFTLQDRELEELGEVEIHEDGSKTLFPEMSRSALSDMFTLNRMPPFMRPRAVALRPGGPTALMLSEFNVAVRVGGYLFVHGGFTPEHLDALAEHEFPLEQLNYETRQYLRGLGEEPRLLQDPQSPLWARDFSSPNPRASDCERLEDTLRRLHVDGMVVGHTPQAMGVNAACGGLVWRVDTGLSASYGGALECLEIERDRSIKVLTFSGAVAASTRVRDQRSSRALQ